MTGSYLFCGQEFTTNSRLTLKTQSSASFLKGWDYRYVPQQPSESPFLSEICTEFSDEAGCPEMASEYIDGSYTFINNRLSCIGFTYLPIIIINSRQNFKQ